MKNKFVASLMTALMAVVILVSPALAATALNTYPTFLGKSGDFYVVVGEKAATADVVGAIDIAYNLATGLATPSTSGSTTTSGLVGTERKVSIPALAAQGAIAGTNDPNKFPTTLRNFHYSGLKEGKYTYLTTDHNYHESVVLPLTTTVALTHSLGSPVNGTLKMKIDGNTVQYRYVFDDTIAAADFGYTSANSSSYTNPLKITIADVPFQIVAIPSTTSFKALVGAVGWVTQGSETGLTAGDLTAVIDTVYSNTQASVRIIDATGNTVTNLGVVGTTAQSFAYGGSTYNVKVLQTATISVAGAGENQAQLVFGKGDIEKVFDGNPTLATISQWGDNWVISGIFAAQGRVTSGDYITVTYNPQNLAEADRYFVAGTTFQGPGNYFELKYAGYYPGNFAKVTVTDSGSVTLYSSTSSTGWSLTNPTGYNITSNLRGLKISSGVAGTLVNGGLGYTELYVLFNGSATVNDFNSTGVWLGYKDTATSRIVNMDTTTYPLALSVGPGLANPQQVKFTLSYGGPGASAVYNFNATLSDTKLIASATIDQAGVVTAALNFGNSSQASTTGPIQLRLGLTTGTVDTNDAMGRAEGSLTDISSQVGDIITDQGVILYSVKGNVLSDKMDFGIPPEVVFGLVQFGKVGPTTTTGGTTPVVSVTPFVAKLDSKVTATDKSIRSFVLVGGPCANTLVQDLMKANTNYANYTCGGSKWVPNTGYIIVVDNAFVTGKSAVVVAGYEAAETKLATEVLTQYGTTLSSKTSNLVTIQGTAIATATIS